jgi:hypothetical protein
MSENPAEEFAKGNPSGDSGPRCEDLGVTCSSEGHECFFDLFPGDVDEQGFVVAECSCCGEQQSTDVYVPRPKEPSPTSKGAP